MQINANLGKIYIKTRKFGLLKMINIIRPIFTGTLLLTIIGTSITSAQELTSAQRNAVRSAKSYLEMKGFSRNDLIEQLSSEYGDGYDLADATAAVDSMSVDWNAQAARSAKSYLEMTGFSCKGLIKQLSSDAGDKFTKNQATYGARQAGAC